MVQLYLTFLYLGIQFYICFIILSRGELTTPSPHILNPQHSDIRHKDSGHNNSG